MDRRRFLRYGMGLAGAGLLSLGLGDLASGSPLGGTGAKSSTASKSSTTTSTFSSEQYASLPDYQEFLEWLNSVSAPYSGKTINLTMEAEFGTYALQLISTDFSSASRINDQYNILPYALQLQTVEIMSATQSPTYDVYSLDIENLGLFPGLALSPLELAEKYPDLTYPGIDFSDFNQTCWDDIATYPPNPTQAAGGGTTSTVQTLPFDTPTLVLFYRTDIFDKLGLTPATTWDEHFENTKTIYASGLIPFGSTSMAVGDIDIIYEYLAYLTSYGGSYFEVDGNTITPSMNSDQAVAALEDFVSLQPYSDPGSAYDTWDTVFESVARNIGAQALMWNGYAQWINDPQRSEVAGQIGYAPVPAGPEGSFSPYAGSGVGVSSYSRNPEMAWLWAQWATAKGTQEAMILDEYHVYPTRSSVVDAPPVAGPLETSALAIASLTNQVWESKSITNLISFPDWLKVVVIIGTNLNSAWRGAVSPSDALATCQTQIEQQVGTITF